jgi:hypothetical protein
VRPRHHLLRRTSFAPDKLVAPDAAYVQHRYRKEKMITFSDIEDAFIIIKSKERNDVGYSRSGLLY